MADFNRLPGIIVRINDGGLQVAPPVRTSPRVLILGTAYKGPAYVPVELNSLSEATVTFGNTGTLIPKAIEAMAGGADNIALFRVGSTASYVEHVGWIASGTPGVSVIFEEHSPTIDEDYAIYFKDGLLKVYTSRGTLVYSNDTNDPIDYNLVTVSGTMNNSGGEGIYKVASGDADFENSVMIDEFGDYSVTEAALVTGSTGLSLTKRRLFEVCYTSFALLDGYDSDIVVIAGAFADEGNVAYYDDDNPNKADHDPLGNENVLGWFKAIADEDNNELYKYFWSETKIVTTGAPAATAYDTIAELEVIAPSAIVFASATDRLNKDFHEVNFAYLLANYCYQMTKNNNEMIGVIAVKGPRTAKLYDLNKWVGVMPEYNETGQVVNDGSGMLGFPLTMGCSNSRLNILVRGQSEGRLPGLFATGSEFIDGDVVYDDNQYKVDIGAYISIVGEYPMIVVNNYPYVGPIDGLYAGQVASLDPKSSTTFKPLGSVKQRYKLSKAKHDELIAAKIVMMDNVPIKGYCVVDGMTAATDVSDFRRLTTVRILHLVSQRMRRATIPFIGEAMLDSPKRIAMAAAIENEYAQLAKRGYLQDYDFNIVMSKYDQVQGRVFVYHTFVPALETRRITHVYQFTI